MVQGQHRREVFVSAKRPWIKEEESPTIAEVFRYVKERFREVHPREVLDVHLMSDHSSDGPKGDYDTFLVSVTVVGFPETSRYVTWLDRSLLFLERTTDKLLDEFKEQIQERAEEIQDVREHRRKEKREHHVQDQWS